MSYRTPMTSLKTLAFGLALSAPAFADGNEKLGPPVGLNVASNASEVLVAGVGMKDKFEGIINMSIPQGVAIKQVLAYWEGQALASDEQGNTDDVFLNDIPVTGSRIGGPTNFFFSRWSSSYRADVTSLGLVTNGDNVVKVRGLNFRGVSNGLGLAVIIDDGANTGVVTLRDGNDNAFRDFANPLDVTETQTYSFPSADEDRTASLAYFFGSVAPQRPSRIEVKIQGPVDSTVNMIDVLGNNDGAEWDSYSHQVTIPAGSTAISLRVVSEDTGAGPFTGNKPASLTWIFNSFSLPKPKAKDCGPELWKKNIALWDGRDGNDVTCRIKTRTNWMRLFWVSPRRSGLGYCKTVLDAICMKGDSDLARLNRHTAAALLAADSKLEYAYELWQIRKIYRDAVGAQCGPETIKTALAKFEKANELYCTMPKPRQCKPRIRNCKPRSSKSRYSKRRSSRRNSRRRCR